MNPESMFRRIKALASPGPNPEKTSNHDKQQNHETKSVEASRVT